MNTINVKETYWSKNIYFILSEVFAVFKQKTGIFDKASEWIQDHSENTITRPSKIKIDLLISELAFFVHPLVTQKNIKVEIIGNTNSYIMADKGMLRTVLKRIIFKTLDKTFKDGVITISISNTITDVLIAVSNSGKIISQDYLLDHNHSTHNLYSSYTYSSDVIVFDDTKDIIEKNKGVLWIENPSNESVSYFISLPIINI